MNTEKSGLPDTETMKSTEDKPLPDHEVTAAEHAEADARGANVGAIVAIGRFGFVRALRPVAKPKAPHAGPRSAA